MNSALGYVNEIESALIPLANDQRAAAMAAYMKEHFSFLGIPSPARRAAIKPLPKPDPADVYDIVKVLWTQEAREYQYVALDLLDTMAKKIDPRATIALIEELTLKKSWWDSVDGFAGVASGILRRNHELRDIVWRWSAHPSFWVNRLAILHQNGWKNETDSDILFKLCLDHAESKEFFIRKAIGWALRDYAWVNAAAVQSFVQKNHACLSKLSIREALKNVGTAEAK
jgi:3-methyladenine DNA glycosylase AlkD